MSLETAAFIEDLVATNPVGATDFVSQGDDHIRLLKTAVKGSFPSLGQNAVSLTALQINDAALKSATQTVTGAWSFSSAPTMAGTNISALNASNLTTGTVPDARFPAVLPALNGSALTNLNATNLATGTVADGRLSSNVPLKNAANTFTAAQAVTSATASALFLTTTGDGNPLVFTNGTVSCAAGIFTNFAYIGTTSNHAFSLLVNGSAVATVNAGLQMGSPTGGDKGAGTINAAGDIYINGEALALRNLLYRLITGDDNTVATDAGRSLAYTGAGGHTLTVDSDLPDGAVVMLVNSGTAAWSIANGLGGTLNWYNGSGAIPTGTRSLAVGAMATIWRIGTAVNIWGVGIS